MPITIAQMLQGMASSGEGASDAVNQKARDKRTAELQQYLQQQEPDVAGRKQAAQNESNMKTMNDPRVQNLVNDGGSAKVGDISIGGNPYAKMANAGPKEAMAFLKNAQGAYKGINDQLDSAQGTLDALNQGNAASDKLALINEARLAAGAGGSRAIKSIMDSLTGGKTVGMDFQNALNYMQNTPQDVVMQPGQRDAIRESVYGRMGQVGQMHEQAKQQLMQQGPIVAPHADTAGIISSLVTPADQKLQKLKSMQQQYQSQRQSMQGQPSVSRPSQADANPTTFDRLKSLFSGGGPQQAPAAAPQQSGGMDLNDPGFAAFKKQKYGQ